MARRAGIQPRECRGEEQNPADARVHVIGSRAVSAEEQADVHCISTTAPARPSATPMAPSSQTFADDQLQHVAHSGAERAPDANPHACAGRPCMR